MRFFDHPFPRLEPSFVSHEDILAYLQSYSDKFDLDRVIQFQHQVVNVRPLPEDRWEVIWYTIFFQMVQWLELFL